MTWIRFGFNVRHLTATAHRTTSSHGHSGFQRKHASLYCPVSYSSPENCAEKNGKLAPGIITKSGVIQETCTKIVAMFYSASLIRNDHGEQELFVLTEFGYKHL